MHSKGLQIDDARLVAAIRAAEARTSGELRVSVDTRGHLPPLEAAVEAFRRLGMDRTKLRNGILFLVQPSTHRFAVIGDQGIHAKVGQAFWDGLAAILHGHFKEGRFTEGLETALAAAGEALGSHFPPEGENPNELPDAVDRSST